MSRRRTVKAPKGSSARTEVKPSRSGAEINEQYPVFSFQYFCGQCIRVDKKINNFYLKDKDAAADVGRFYDITKEISKHKLGELLKGKVFHFHPIHSQSNIKNIEKFLSAHGFADAQLQDFSANYVQFSLNDGGRAICMRIDQVIYVLFIDVNHFVYNGSSRDEKQKHKHQIPGYFTEKDANCDHRSFAKAEMIDDLLNNFDNYKTKDDLRAHLEFISNPEAR